MKEKRTDQSATRDHHRFAALTDMARAPEPGLGSVDLRQSEGEAHWRRGSESLWPAYMRSPVARNGNGDPSHLKSRPHVPGGGRLARLRVDGTRTCAGRFLGAAESRATWMKPTDYLTDRGPDAELDIFVLSMRSTNRIA